MKAFIKGISYYLPNRVVTNEELVKDFPEWSVEKVAGKIGISERHIAAENETAADMAVKAAQKLFKEHQVDRSFQRTVHYRKPGGNTTFAFRKRDVRPQKGRFYRC